MRKTRLKSFKKFNTKRNTLEEPEIKVSRRPKEKDMRFEIFTELRERLIDIESKGPDLQKIIDMQKKRKDEVNKKQAVDLRTQMNFAEIQENMQEIQKQEKSKHKGYTLSNRAIGNDIRNNNKSVHVIAGISSQKK